MRTIRLSTFETNSSSCHCLQILYQKDWEDFKNGELFINRSPFEINSHSDLFYDMRPDIIEYEKSWKKWFITKNEVLDNLFDFLKKNETIFLNSGWETTQKLWKIVFEMSDEELKIFLRTFFENYCEDNYDYDLIEFDEITVKISDDDIFKFSKLNVGTFASMVEDEGGYTKNVELFTLPYSYKHEDPGWFTAKTESFMSLIDKRPEKNIVIIERNENC